MGVHGKFCFTDLNGVNLPTDHQTARGGSLDQYIVEEKSMMEAVTYRVEGDIAVLEVNNPPVNALSHAVRQGMRDNTVRAIADTKVKAIVLIGKRVFLGGADIKEFETRGSGPKLPSLVEVADKLEGSKKPVVAAISGFALGGGFEVAICCHYRVAEEKVQFGFPEVDIGILPAATGTQRYPRLVGLQAALDIIPTGRRITALEALRIGAIDKIVRGDLLSEAIRFAQSVAKEPLDGRRVSLMRVKDANQAVELRDAAVRRAQQKSRGMLAPLFCIKAVMAAVEFSIEEGFQKETEYASVLFTSGQARALQYAFFAQRAAVKWNVPGIGSHKSSKPLPLRTGAVVGAGTMGTGIAMAMLNAGLPVVLLEQNEEFLKKGVALLQSLYDGSVKLKRMSAAEAKAKMAMLKPSVNYGDIKNADIVVEAVYENMTVKQDVFRKLDKVCSPTAVLCSNTSYLDIDKMASVTSRPERVVGTHFFVPAYHMRLLENVRGAKSSAETIATVQSFGQKLGKVPVLVGNCFGFTANRMRSPHVQEGIFLVEEGALPEEIDQVMEDFGIPLGPMKVADLSGLDIGASVRKEQMKALGIEITLTTQFVNGVRISTLADYLVSQGRLGRKTGKGFYRYEKPYAKQPYNDPYIKELIITHSKNLGIVRRKISNQEILERMLYSAINEGFKIMEEGISTCPEEIDTIWLLGFGWPRYLGGPMYYANTVGIENVYRKICYYYDKHPTSPHWQPSSLLRRLVENKVPFKLWSEQVAQAAASHL